MTVLEKLQDWRRQFFSPHAAPIALVDSAHIEPLPAAVTGETMNFLSILLQYILPLANAAVLGIQQIHGDAVSGKDKFSMALDALNSATAAVIPTLGGNNQVLGAVASVIAQGAIQSAYVLSKANGTYAAATAVAAAPVTQPVAATPASV